MKSGEMKHEITLFHTMGPNRNVTFQIHLRFCDYGLMWSSSVKLFTQDDAGLFESPLLPRTPLNLVMSIKSFQSTQRRNVWIYRGHFFLQVSVGHVTMSANSR